MIDFDVKSQSYSYGILSYNQNNGEGKNNQHLTFIDSKFDIQYKDSTGTVQRVPYINITPKKLFYDSLNNKLYLMAHAAKPFLEEAVVIYEILPVGYFYVSDANKVYQVDVSGKIDVYVNSVLLSYNKGLFDPQTQTYEQPSVNNNIINGESMTFDAKNPSVLSFSGSPLFTIDHNGNILIYDSLNGILRRINIY